MLEIVAATTNSNKIAELAAVASEFGIRVLSPTEVQQRKGLGPIPKFDEDDL